MQRASKTRSVSAIQLGLESQKSVGFESLVYNPPLSPEKLCVT